MRKVFNPESKDTTSKFSLIFGNTTLNDILFKEELDGYAKAYPDRFKVIYALDNPVDDWAGHRGYLTKELLAESLPKSDVASSVIFVCGPPPMMEIVSGDKNPDKSQGTLRGFLKELGYLQDRVCKL